MRVTGTATAVDKDLDGIDRRDRAQLDANRHSHRCS
jgi:hypothetical protein